MSNIEQLTKLAMNLELDLNIVFESTQNTWYISMKQILEDYKSVSKSYSDLDDIIEIAINDLKSIIGVE